MNKIGFDNGQYLERQSREIEQRIANFGGKLYLEFGGKLFDDFHASRVLPGFQPDSKLQMLRQLRDKAEVIIAISADDIEKNKVRGDLGITYDADVLRLMDAFRAADLYVGSVVITKFGGQAAAVAFQEKLERLGIRVFRHYSIEGYPRNVQHIVSDQGFGRNEYIETTRPLAVVTAPGPGSGKMAVCLSQLYHENVRGIRAGYAKFETFPVWNLPLQHPVNLAYEAATVDLRDVNMIDPWHLAAYGVTTVNYNRDVEVFPVLNAMFQKIYGTSPYQSPTDMGVNMVGSCIVDDGACCRASRDEIVRRYFKTLCDARKGMCDQDLVAQMELIMSKAGVDPDSRDVVHAARVRAQETNEAAMAIRLPDGQIVTGRTSALLGPSAAALLNAAKQIGGVAHEKHLIPPEVFEPIQALKTGVLGNHNPRLHSDEVLIALSISALTSPEAAVTVRHLQDLRGCEAHSTVILPQVDEDVYRKLGLNLTCDPQYRSKKLYHK